MKRIKVIGCILSLTLLNLVLTSCNKEYPQSAEETEILMKPQIIPAEGNAYLFDSLKVMNSPQIMTTHKIQFEEENIKQGIYLEVNTTCLYNEKKWTKNSGKMPLKHAFYFYEFIPMDALYNSSGSPLKDVTCHFDFLAHMNEEAIHSFSIDPTPIISGPLKNPIELKENAQFMDYENQANISIVEENFSNTWIVPKPVPDQSAKLTMICENFTSEFLIAPNNIHPFSQFSLPKDQITEKPRQTCRLFQIDLNGNIISLSPYLRITFSPPLINVDLHFNPPPHFQLAPSPSNTLFTTTLHNILPYPVHLLLKKEPTTKILIKIYTIYFGDFKLLEAKPASLFFGFNSDAKVIDAGSHYKITLPAHSETQVSIGYKLNLTNMNAGYYGYYILSEKGSLFNFYQVYDLEKGFNEDNIQTLYETNHGLKFWVRNSRHKPSITPPSTIE